MRAYREWVPLLTTYQLPPFNFFCRHLGYRVGASFILMGIITVTITIRRAAVVNLHTLPGNAEMISRHHLNYQDISNRYIIGHRPSWVA